MSREIEFNVWLSEYKVMLTHSELKAMHSVQAFRYITGNMKIAIPLQYTGLQDKYDKKIFEGHIVEWSNFDMCPRRLYYVRWVKEGLSYELTGKTSRDCHKLYPDRTDGMKVIGNFYENPELLK